MKKEETKNKSEVALKEEEILRFWKDNKIFEKSLEKGDEEFVVYDGPPFATGLPHYGHLLQSFIKDALPRYKTMRGFRVPRRWGWDCHGLPLENVVEKELGLKTKKDIEDYGIDKFNDVAKTSVLRYADDWREIIPRVGRWVDMDNDYKTMDWKYTETVWWIFKNLYDKGLIYEGYKSMQLCPRCGTTLSNFEVSQGYKDVKDISVYVKFELVDEPPSTSSGQVKTFLIAWTTTPWTLPGNTALAINQEINYVVVSKDGGEKYVVAEDRFKELGDKLKEFEGFSVQDTIKGKDLVGKKYKPVFDCYQKTDLPNFENGWKVYGADFVTTGDGTGIVHIAPAFGQDDYNLALKEKLPFIQHVGMDGKFKSEVTGFAGMDVKPKSDDDKIRLGADIAILKHLQEKGTFFAKENLVHSYAHCWRCDSPLLNYASDSWFVKVSEIKDKMIAENKKIGWIPEHIRDGRFGRGLESAPDWAISRSRYWGAPLPVWRCSDCKKERVLGNIDELRTELKNKITKVILIRHGESEKNTKEIWTSSDEGYPLTEVGEEQAKETAENLKDENIDAIFSSSNLRAKQTADIVSEKIGVPVSVAKELKEVFEGQWEGMGVPEIEKREDRKKYVTLSKEELYKAKRGTDGESWQDMEKRAYDFVKKTVSENAGKTILFVSHQGVTVYLLKAVQDLSLEDTARLYKDPRIIGYANPVYSFVRSDTGKEINLHRPHIDDLVLGCGCGAEMKRIPEVFDCWFESGSMPYGQVHYPFEKNSPFGEFDPEKDIGYPAGFIGEAIDQTRGWFYSLIVLGVGLFGKSPYKNVVTSGLVLAEDGQKMAKKLKNYPDPLDMVNKYGADSLRAYLLGSPLVRGEDLNFSEKGLGEVYRKIILRLENIFTFYETYKDKTDITDTVDSKNVLDRWIMARLNETVASVTKSLEQYELDRALRPIDEFIEDLSVWYIRRSRERFKSEDVNDRKAVAVTTKAVIKKLVLIMAPITPFISEGIYQKIKDEADPESAHLCDWPEINKVDEKVIEEMQKARNLVSTGLLKRAEAGVRVRQPLKSVVVKLENLSNDYVEIIKDELNVKEVLFDENLDTDARLDLNITRELQEEGNTREIIRNLQGLRKEMGLTPDQEVNLFFDGGEEVNELVKKFEGEIKRVVGVKELKLEKTDEMSEIKIEGQSVFVKIIL